MSIAELQHVFDVLFYSSHEMELSDKPRHLDIVDKVPQNDSVK